MAAAVQIAAHATKLTRGVGRLSDGTLLSPVQNGNDISFYESTDSGATWADTSSDLSESSALVPLSIFVASDDTIWVAARLGSGYIVAYQGVYSSGTITWDAGSTGYISNGSTTILGDIAAYPVAADEWRILLVSTGHGTVDSGTAYAQIVTKETTFGYSALQSWYHTGNVGMGHGAAAAAWQHDGDGKTALATPRGYSGSRGYDNSYDLEIHSWKMSDGTVMYSDDNTTYGQGVVTDLDSGRIWWDGTALMAAVRTTASPYFLLNQYDQDVRNEQQFASGAPDIDPSNRIGVYSDTDRNVYLLQSDGTYLKRLKWTRTANSWGTLETVAVGDYQTIQPNPQIHGTGDAVDVWLCDGTYSYYLDLTPPVGGGWGTVTI